MLSHHGYMPHLWLRAHLVHMQMVLANIAMLAENGQVLLDSKLPEEFLVAVPMRLSEVGGLCLCVGRANRGVVTVPTHRQRDSKQGPSCQSCSAVLASAANA